MKIGFIGLGNMGSAMALNLARAGAELVLWNRSPDKARAVAAAAGGAPCTVADSAEQLFAQAEVIILMLANGAAIDEVLARDTPGFAARVAGRTVVHMGTTAPGYSQALEAAIRAKGGCYVEAPVSGSRVPAEQGNLVGMLAGDPAALERVAPLLQAMCAQIFVCGAVPQALRMKLSVNLFLITMVCGLAEATRFARQQGVDLSVFRSILDAGPMASKVSSIKLAKLVENDFSVQASMSDVLMNSQLIQDAARASAIGSPLIDLCRDLFERGVQLGHGGADMAAVIHALPGRAT